MKWSFSNDHPMEFWHLKETWLVQLYFTNPLQPIKSNQIGCVAVIKEDRITSGFLPENKLAKILKLVVTVRLTTGILKLKQLPG